MKSPVLISGLLGFAVSVTVAASGCDEGIVLGERGGNPGDGGLVEIDAFATLDGDASHAGDATARDGAPLPDVADGSPSPCAPPVSALCSENPRGPIATPTEIDFDAAIVHRWILCANESVFAVNDGQVGIDVTADGHWYWLYPATNGGVVRGAGAGEEGTWSLVQVGDYELEAEPFQMNLDILGGGWTPTFPAFAATPQAVRLDAFGILVGTYVVDPSIPSGDARCTPADAQ